MLKIGIVAALAIEADPIVRSLGRCRREAAGDFRIHRGTAGGSEVWVIVSGVGKAAARRAATTLVSIARPDFVISTGLAGGLSEDMPEGSIVVAGAHVDEAGAREQFVAPPGLVLPPGCRRETLLTSRRFVSGAVLRKELSDRYGAAVVDMESIHVGRVAGEAGLPFLAVRVISDDRSADLPAVGSFMTAEGAVMAGRAVLYFLRHPRTLIPFLRFMRGMSRHARTLSLFLSDLIAGLPRTG